MKNLSKAMLLLVAGLALLFAGAASAQNYAPPAGAFMDLAGLAVPTDYVTTPAYTQYTGSFMATGTSTTVTFLFRDDPGYIGFDDASVTQGANPNMLANPGFETGDLTGWTYLNKYGVSFAGVVCATPPCQSLSPRTGGSFWVDGATQGYDALSQVLSTVIGDTYDVSFWLAQHDDTGFNPSNFQQTSTNGNPGTDGNGLDVLVYAGAQAPPGIPEPTTLLLLGSGLIGLVGLGWRKN